MDTSSVNNPAHGQDCSEIFVGRRELLDAVLEGLNEVGALRMDDISGQHGIGKSSILQRLRELADSTVTAILVDLEKYDPGHTGDVGERISITAIQVNFQFFTQLLLNLLASLHPDRVPEMEHAIHLERNSVNEARSPMPTALQLTNKVELGAGATMKSSPSHISVALGPQQLADLYRRAANRVADAFVGYVNERGGNSPVLLLFDNVDRYANQEIGPWFHDVLRRLEHAVIVLTREVGTPLSVPGGVCRIRTIPPLSPTEVEQYLRMKVSPAPLGGGVAQLVHAFSNGYPVVLGIVYDLVFQGGSEVHLTDVEEQLSHMPTEWPERLAALVKSIVTRLAERRLDNALQAAIIPRCFGTPLLHILLTGENDSSGSDTPHVLEELSNLTFVERVPDEKEFLLRAHSFVRDGLSDWMQSFNPDRFLELHRRAARFYYRRLMNPEIDDSPTKKGVAGGYGSWFLYENSQWQRDKKEWLYHLGRSGTQVETLLEFTRVFLDAFWWWGMYMHFDFCDDLVHELKDLAKLTKSPATAALAQALDTLLQEYPARYNKEFSKPRDAGWDSVRRALLSVRAVCGLRRRQANWSEDQRHVAALINAFLAHSYRYKDPTSPESATCYEKADALFTANDDTWNMAWVSFERADLALDRGDVHDALVRSADAATKVYRAAEGDELDDEIIANLHRLRADCYWKLGHYDRAARLYGRAVVHAYRFHNTGGPPDECTVQFYVEMRGRAITRVIDLWQADSREKAVRIATLMREVMPSVWNPPADLNAPLDEILARYGDVQLALALFPRGPTPSEIGLRDSPFMNEWHDVDAAIDDSFDEDLVPPAELGG